jgi:hypothetical protein
MLWMSTAHAHDTNWVPRVGDFATRLVLIRHEMGWNAKEAALACGIKAQSWREWELLGRRPRDYEAVCRRIAARTGVDLVWLSLGIEPPLPRVDSNHQPFGQRSKVAA